MNQTLQENPTDLRCVRWNVLRGSKIQDYPKEYIILSLNPPTPFKLLHTRSSHSSWIATCGFCYSSIVVLRSITGLVLGTGFAHYLFISLLAFKILDIQQLVLDIQQLVLHKFFSKVLMRKQLQVIQVVLLSILSVFPLVEWILDPGSWILEFSGKEQPQPEDIEQSQAIFLASLIKTET
jgi:hypothetical protein